MAIYEQINGHLINIRSVLVDDAPFIVGIRNNNKLNKFINPVDKSIELQRCWIEEQNKRANDYYFIIEDKSKVPLGTISLYKILDDQGEWGRWVSVGNPIQNIESAILIHDFAFINLKLNLVYSKVIDENVHVLNFNKSFGAKKIGTPKKSKNGYFLQLIQINQSEFFEIKEKHLKLINYYK
jgi:RimJ/RimL family protein N-acetyltransferase